MSEAYTHACAQMLMSVLKIQMGALSYAQTLKVAISAPVRLDMT